MSDYHYNFGPGGGRNNRPSGGGLIELLMDIAVSVIVAIPMGIAFLVRTIVGLLSSEGAARPGQSAQGVHTAQTSQSAQTGGQSGSTYHYAYAPGEKQEHVGVQSQYNNLHKVQRPTAEQEKAAKEAKQAAKASGRKVKLTAGRSLAVLGGIGAGFWGVLFLCGMLGTASPLYCIVTGILAGGGLLTLFAGLRRRKKVRLYLKYLGLIGRRESVSISTLAKAAGRSRKKVCRELQDMLDEGILPAGYLDLDGDKLVLSEKGIDDKPAEEPAPQAPADENDILREIREVNDSIPDPVMSAKIDRIGEITGKILEYQRKNPGKAGQLRSFLNYYLPTTLKILRAYAQLDQQGVEGENISAAKARIEGMMDKVVEGFEKQLDRLFQDDALDITSDVAVLEQMLDNDGLGGNEGLTLGGT